MARIAEPGVFIVDDVAFIKAEDGLSVAINIIADPDWEEARFASVREWAMSVPEIVNITVQTPCPGTGTWFTASCRLTTLDYRLFDVQHAVLPTRLPLPRFYAELVKTQAVPAQPRKRRHPRQQDFPLPQPRDRVKEGPCQGGEMSRWPGEMGELTHASNPDSDARSYQATDIPDWRVSPECST